MFSFHFHTKFVLMFVYFVLSLDTLYTPLFTQTFRKTKLDNLNNFSFQPTLRMEILTIWNCACHMLFLATYNVPLGLLLYFVLKLSKSKENS